MQIIDLYIRDTFKYTSVALSFPTNTRLVDPSTDFTDGRFKVGQIIKNLENEVEGVITAIAPSGTDTLDIDGGNFVGNYQRYQIYNDYTKLELFKDESVSITDTIQNVKDPAKIFAPFSQQFNVPASKHNNKFFKHYYNSEIANSYDARFQGDALIQLNGVNYKIGKLRLMSVELKNNVAYSYKLVFTGETVEFKQILAENELSSLEFPESLDFEYTSDFVKSKLQGSAEGDDLIFPLITHSKNMRYNYNSTTGYRDAISGTRMNYADLKPALKTKVIIDAIESNYPQIKFSNTFFNSYSFKKLYLWLHREEGFMSNAVEGGSVNTITRLWHTGSSAIGDLEYDFDSGTDLRPAYPFFETLSILGWTEYQFILTVNTLVSQDYTVEFRRMSNNDLVYEVQGSATQTFDPYYANPQNWGEGVIALKIIIIADNTLGISQDLEVRKVRNYGNGDQDTLEIGYYEAVAPTSENIITISSQMPKMKIFDFLKNIFTMFNLTAYKENGLITVLPLDDYYNAGKVYDITKYVDTSKKTVSKLLQFRNMIFNFKSKKSFLVQYSDELQGNKFAEESFTSEQYDGSDYKVEVDFEKMMYERLSDESDGSLTDIVQGAMLDKKFEPTIGSPLLFYCFSTPTSQTLFFENPNGTGNNINPYLRPSNSISDISTGFINETLNFGIEVDEYTLGTGSSTQNAPTDLFTKYYKNYVANLFARNSRKTNVSAYLPLNVILNYRLNDIFIIGTTEYRINSIKTNLLTNKSDLELYNLQVNTSQSLNGQRQDLQRVQNLETTSKTSSTISVEWDEITEPNILGYEILLDDVFWDFNSPGDLTAGIGSLESGTTYKISLRARYSVDGGENGAFDTDLFETTL